MSNSDDSWASDFNELPSFEEWNSLDGDFESHVTNTNHGDGKIDHLEPSTSGDLEDIGYVDPGRVHGHGGLPQESTYPQILRSGITMDTSRVPLDDQTQCDPYQALNSMSTGHFETFDAESVPGNPIDLGRPKKGLGIPIPLVVVSDATVNTVSRQNENAVPAWHTNISSPTRHDDGTRTLDQSLRKALASSESTEYPLDDDWYRPNNYQIAMPDRRPPYTLGTGDQSQFGTRVADSVSAFYADADQTVLDRAAFSKIDGNMRGVTGSISMFQTPIRPPGLQRCRSSSSTASSCSIPRSSIQTPLFSTPPSSLQETTEYQQVTSHLTRDRSLSNPARLPSVCLTDSSSLTSLSPPNARDGAENPCCCPHCPDKTFTDKSNLKRHMRDRHKRMPRLSCLKEGCDASFAPGRKDNRLKHVRAKHPDYLLPPPSRRRKRNADNDMESGSIDMESFKSGTTE